MAILGPKEDGQSMTVLLTDCQRVICCNLSGLHNLTSDCPISTVYSVTDMFHQGRVHIEVWSGPNVLLNTEKGLVWLEIIGQWPGQSVPERGDTFQKWPHQWKVHNKTLFQTK